MSEIEVPAHIVGRRYNCDECGEEMAPSGNTMLATSPPQYPHACPNGHRANLSRKYPGYDVFIATTPGGSDA